MDRPKQDLLLGLVFFGALAGLLAATLFLKGVSLEETQERTVFFANAGGLAEGDRVFLLGKRIGQVTEVRYDSEAEDVGRRIVSRIRFDRPVTLRRGYSVKIQEGSLLGGRQLQIEPGSDPDVIPVEEPLLGENAPGAMQALADLVGDPELESDLKGILRGLREAIEDVNSGQGTIGRLLSEDGLYTELLYASQSLRKSLEAIEQERGLVGVLIHDASLAEDVRALAGGLRSIAEKADEGQGLVGRLLNDPSLAENTDAILADLAVVTGGLREGRGAVGALLSDDKLAEDLRTTLAQIATFTENLNDAEAGLIGELVAGKETRARFVQLVADLQYVGGELRDGNGLLPRLLSDPELGEQFSRVLNQVARAIEDARESAPIGTFFQVFSGGF